MKRTVALVIALSVISTCPASVGEAHQNNTAKQALSAAPAAEMPAKAAELVKNVRARDQGSVTVDVVRAAGALNPGAAPAVVGAIAKAVPDMAAIAAGTAAEIQPRLAVQIAKAAAAGAPAQAGRIAAAVSRVVPQEYRAVAAAVYEVAPGANRDILSSMASAFPSLKPAIQKGLANSGTAATVPAVLAPGHSLPTTVASRPGPELPVTAAGPGTLAPRGPLVQPPFVPPTASGPTITPVTSGPVPPGDRSYASP